MSNVVNEREKILEDSFVLWSDALWLSYCYHNPAPSFEQQTNKFFDFLKDLLDEGEVKFVRPGADVTSYADDGPKPTQSINDPEAQWNVSSDEIVSYLKARWPQGAKRPEDNEIMIYWYTMPGIMWNGHDGKWYAS